MSDYTAFLNRLSRHAEDKLRHWAAQLPEQIAYGLRPERYGDLPRWQQALTALPDIDVQERWLDRDRVGVAGDITSTEREQLETALRALHPWRKGPFELFGLHIDTEWRSDWKWQRLLPGLDDLAGRSVLDVGCGSGYHCWRMEGAGADTVVGIDPTPLFVMQYFALNRYLQSDRTAVLPLGIEHMPDNMQCFDTVFSMGILYHRRSPFDHLIQLRELLRKDGQLILETLVIDGELGQVLVPEGRYARMGNVWFLPSVDTLLSWLKKAGFKQPELIDVTVTSTEEQRQTDWMQFHSLAQFLDADNPELSIEGYPAPKRAIISARRP